jgi:hypothetical protein
MNTDVAHLLHESIDRLTDGARVPEGLADRALRHNRQRRIALGTAAVTGTATIAAVAVLVTAAVSGPPPRPGVLTAQTAAFVLGRTERALTSAERENLVQEIRTVATHAGLGLTELVPDTGSAFSAGTSLVERLVPPFVPETLTWAYRNQLREKGFDASGKLIFDAASTTVLTPTGPLTGMMRARGVGVDYQASAWWRATIRQSVETDLKQFACWAATLPPPVGSPVDWTAKVAWPAKIRAALACGHYRIAGHQRMDGVKAIKLVSVPRRFAPPAPVSQTVWVDASTYLPLRLAWAWAVPDASGSLVGDFKWLRPTKANLADLQVTVPPGFHRRLLGGLPVPGQVFYRIRGS